MDFEDLLEPEVAVGAAVAAAIFSPQVRGLLRKGAVYGLAGVLVAGDAITTAAKGAGTSMRQAGTAASEAMARSRNPGQSSDASGAAAETATDVTPPTETEADFTAER